LLLNEFIRQPVTNLVCRASVRRLDFKTADARLAGRERIYCEITIFSGSRRLPIFASNFPSVRLVSYQLAKISRSVRVAARILVL
jgi:hypothetical protein